MIQTKNYKEVIDNGHGIPKPFSFNHQGISINKKKTNVVNNMEKDKAQAYALVFIIILLVIIMVVGIFVFLRNTGMDM